MVTSRMCYNVSKYKSLLAIKECNDLKIPATPYLVSKITGLPVNNQKMYLSRYYRTGYLKRKVYEERKRFRSFQYFIDEQGESVIEKYSDRYVNGYDLNIRKMPVKTDWSDVELLPGLHVLEELSGKKKK